MIQGKNPTIVKACVVGCEKYPGPGKGGKWRNAAESGGMHHSARTRKISIFNN